jgi:hypothetical protein
MHSQHSQLAKIVVAFAGAAVNLPDWALHLRTRLIRRVAASCVARTLLNAALERRVAAGLRATEVRACACSARSPLISADLCCHCIWMSHVAMGVDGLVETSVCVAQMMRRPGFRCIYF